MLLYSYLAILASVRLCSLFHHPAPTEIYTLSLHDALPIFERRMRLNESVVRILTVVHVPPELSQPKVDAEAVAAAEERSEEHTSELQSLRHLVCRLLLEKKKKHNTRKQ